jgi:hypothetical protein
MLGGRDWDLVRRNVLAGPVEAARRYFTGRGDYPWAPALRTPLGPVGPSLHSHHDLLTVNEIFCRRDYAAGPKVRTVVDVGSNIGISALYFLTRDPQVKVRCLEPVPRDVERLKENLAAFTGRFTVEEAAVDATGGEADFGDDPYGRYGGIGVASERTIRARCGRSPTSSTRRSGRPRRSTC